jgi:polyketide synthase PksM
MATPTHPDDPRRAERELGELALRWALASLQGMGVMREPGEIYTLDQLRRRLGVIPRYERYFEALIRRLEREGLVSLAGQGVETTALVCDYALTSVEEQVAEFRESFVRRHPSCAGLLGFMASCLGRFGEILTGRIDAADVVFQDGNMDVFGAVFGGDAVSDYFNRLAAEAVRGAAERIRDRKVRVVEIGAGTGGTTAAILEALQPLSDRVELWFTDISQSFLRHARRRFSQAYPWLGYRTLNIEEDLSRQRFEAHGFDVVVAANVLHDTRDIDFTLEQTRRLLRPGGLLVLNEFTAVKDCLFFSGALLHGYWLFEDPGRRLQDSCLLSVPQWKAALERTGFAAVEPFALPTQKPDSKCGQSVILCEAVGGAEAVLDEAKSDVVGRLVEQDILAILGEERASAYSARRPLMEMGLDSIELVELKSLVRRRFDVNLPPAFLFEHETQEKMAKALAAAVSDEQLRGLEPPPMPPMPPPTQDIAVAIVGVACRFPGGASSPEAFWDLLELGGVGIVPMPPGRWRWPAFVDVNGTHRGIDQAGFLERIDEFDARFFRTSPKEAEWMDPQQRLLLELSWEALEDGGCRPSELSGRRVGVFVGVCQSDYRDVLVANADPSEAGEAYVGSGTAYAMLANRLSYFYDLKGPSLTVDTACSSSLFALHDAVTAMRRGECEAALVGAVNLLCSPTISLSYYQAGMLSPSGRCHTFDEAADGYVRGEGGAMLLLKPLAAALAHGDPVYGLVTGMAVNHGGQATTLTAPKPDAQADVIEAAWAQAGVPADSAGYIEAHGTGTRLGDPIEVSGLTEAFRRLCRMQGKPWPPKPHCGLGSVKTNVGHLEGAAGLAGLVKILMSIRHGRIPGTPGFQRLNPEIDLGSGPFHIADRSRPWPRFRDGSGRELPRRAGVSSFGFGGANAHAVVEEYLDPGAPAAAEGPCLIPLSARSQEELIGRARGLLDFLEQIDRRTGTGGAWVDHVADGLGDILRSRFGLGEECTPDLEWTDLGWGAVETLLFLAAVEEAHGIRLHSRTLIEHPSLRSLAESLARNWREPSPSPDLSGDLADVAYTLQAGREPMAERVVFLADGRDDLVSALRSYVAGAPEIPGCHRGYSRSAEGDGKREVEAGLAARDLPELASLWARGAEIEWERLYSEARPRRVHLPTYPFARQRCWVPERPKPRRAPSRRLRPEAYRFSTLLTGDEFFVADHVIQGRRVLPAVACLEMAREAVEEVAGAGGVRLESFAWVRPIVVDRSPVRLELRLTPEGDDLRVELYSCSEGSDEIFHAEGRAGTGTGAGAVLDVAAWRARCTDSYVPAEDFYRALSAMGYGYGPAHRAVDALHVGSDEILARLVLPESLAGTREEFVLHPAMADAAVQATIGFALIDGETQPVLPFELRSAEIFKPCTPVLWAAVRRGGGRTFDIDLCDETGRLAARFRGLTTRPAAAMDEHLLAPVWEPVDIETSSPAKGAAAIVGGTGRQQAAVQEHLPEARPLLLEPDDSVETLRRKIASWGRVEHVVWIVPPHRPGSMADDSLLSAQRDGVIFGFRLIKAMLGEGYGDRAVTWSVITTGTQTIQAGEIASPAHASVHGLIGSMAKEHLSWTVRLMDMPAGDGWPWRDLLAMAGDPHGNAVAWRDRSWHRQQLVAARVSNAEPPPYRPGGVYVIVGGAGGIGEAWSEALLRRMPVRLAWIGRRPEDEAIRARLDRLAELGPRPLYIAADATDREQLDAARARVVRELGRVNGVIHAAIVLRDRSLAGMTEDDLRAGLAPKIDVCVRLAQVFGEEPLDFALFFSSMLSFLKWPGQSNYVAGCVFKDAFANRLAAEWPCPVRVINWGYWGSVGAASSGMHRSAMARKGFGSIELREGMAVLDRLLAGPVRQLLYVKTTDSRALEGVRVRSGAEEPRLPPGWSLANQEVEEALSGLLRVQLPRERAGVVLDRFAPWLERSLKELETRGPGAPGDAEAVWQAWESRRSRWLQDDDWRPTVQLAEAALRALPDILAGRIAATDVLLGDLLGDSASPVSEVYRQGAVTRLCNGELARTVAGYVEERRRRDPRARVRILEIGAGTGATSEVVFEALRDLADGVGEYTFTDLSRAFLARAKKTLASRPAYLRYETFDAEAPPGGQGIEAGSYDLVIATNVLHATRNIRRTLRNAKALLKADGLLVLNEIADNSLFHHLTFGLLDGWWLFEDSELRAPGGPALRPETWRMVLEQEGFRSVRFPAEAAHAAGQQVIIAERGAERDAESDGVLLRSPGAQAVPHQAERGTPVEPGNGRVAPARLLDGTPDGIAELMALPKETAIERLRGHLQQRAAETLSVDPATLDSRSRPFSDALLGEFGMDSLSSNSLRNTLRRDLGVDIAVQQIIAEKVRFLVGDLYEQLLLKYVSHAPRHEDGETETFVF